MQCTPPRTRSQGPAQHPLDPELECRQQSSPSDHPSSLDEPTHPSNRTNPQGPMFCTPGMKPPDKFDSENSSKLQGFLQSCKLLFLNDPTVFSDNRKKFLYAASYLGGRATQWFKPYLDLLENQPPSCLINNWDRFKQQLFNLFRDPNEVRNAEFKLNSLSMKDNGKASTYIAQFWTLQSRIDWNDAAFAFHFRKGLPSRITNQLALTGQRLKTLQQFGPAGRPTQLHQPQRMKMLRKTSPQRNQRDPLKFPWSLL
ncbi:uncharacterized protein VP01_4304g1 [Puccinia sorghi]|uniref:Retrotransposon gag domain-containing protein n=1 Tax=Puccinia sorghi TaxID=27349 RepID=A0A0L6UQZ1_9BASI|nr:uncharacterized protein VP01_4304g1 [Puccinia sorghi]